MLVDLHCHSTCSDGSESPEQIARRASQRELELFCLTDHDTCAGYGPVREACDLPEQSLLRGVELTCREEGRAVHLLVYDVARSTLWSHVEEELVQVQRVRRRRLREISARLDQLGIGVDVDAIIAAAGSRAVGRPDMARALVAAGAVGSTKEAFTRYLRDGGPADVLIERLDVGAGLEIARRADARVALAHPHTLGSKPRERLLRYRDAGLEGIEAYYALYSHRERSNWLRLAADLNLVATAGSDFHGDLFPQIGDVGVELPEPHAGKLCEWLGAIRNSSRLRS